MTPLPQNGDEVVISMDSGKELVCRFYDVEPCGDPRDMFWAKIVALDYLPEGQPKSFTDIRKKVYV